MSLTTIDVQGRLMSSLQSTVGIVLVGFVPRSVRSGAFLDEDTLLLSSTLTLCMSTADWRDFTYTLVNVRNLTR